MSKKQRTKRTIIPTSGAQAFAELHDEIAAFSEELLVPISVDIPFAHQIALAAADRIDQMMPELEKLPRLDIERVRKLRMYAAACQHAHLLAISPEEGDQRLPRLLEEGAKLREDLLSTAELLARFGEVSEERVAAIRSGAGYVDMANDLEQLGVLYEEIWDRVQSRIPVTAEMVERAPGLALELHHLLGAKTVGPVTKPSDAQGMRQRAFTLLVKAYEECQSGVEYLRRHQGDAMLYTPSLFVKKRRRTTSPDNDAPETEASETTSPTAPPTPVRIPTALPLTELAPTG